MANVVNNIDEYIGGFPPNIQETLNEIRNFIKTEAPDATEKISYGMPTFYLNGNLVHFAAFKDHYGFFPAPSGIDHFENELAPYRTGKGTLQFPLDKPLPWDILKKVIHFRIDENLKKVKKMKKPRIFTTPFTSVYPLYIQKVEKKGRTKEEVDKIIFWLTGYDEKMLQKQLDNEVDIETFFEQAPDINDNVSLIKGKICGYQVEDIEDKLMQKIRYIDLLVDELARGKGMDKILRK